MPQNRKGYTMIDSNQNQIQPGNTDQDKSKAAPAFGQPPAQQPPAKVDHPVPSPEKKA